MKQFTPKILGLGLALLAGLTTSIHAQNTLQGVTFHAVGNGSVATDPFFPNNFAPDTSTLQFKNDGTSGDLVAGDSIFTVEANLVPNSSGGWKAASNSFSPINSPTGSNLDIPNTGSTGVVTFYLDTALTGDGFLPEAGTGEFEDGFVYTSLSLDAVNGSDDGTIRMLGSFQSALGGSNFTSGLGELVLTDVNSDDIYTTTVTGIPAGSYEGKFTIGTAGFSKPDFGARGFAGGGNNITFTVLNSTDSIEFSLNAITGRYRIESSTPGVVGEPFYAQSSAWGTGFTSLEQLDDDGTTEFYSKEYVVTTPGDYTLRVTDTAGNRYPSSGNPSTNFYPFTTTTPNQTVRVIFDRRTYNDGFFPENDFVIVVDSVSRETLTTITGIQFTGNFQADFASFGFTVPDSNFVATDDGDGIWTYSTPVGAFSANESNQSYKAVFSSTGGNPTNFTLQIGGGDDGLTTGGNNSNVGGLTYSTGDFIHGKADTRTGRIRMEASPSSANPIGDPARNGAYLPASLNVDNWMMHSF